MRNGKKSPGSRSSDSDAVSDPEIATALEGGSEEAFEDFLEDFYADPEKPLKFLRAHLAGEEAYSPAVDVVETKESITVIADIPGVVEDDLKVEFVDGGVILRGRREPAPSGESAARLRRAERPAGEFTRSVPLPQGLDLRNVAHTLKAGVLTLVLPRLPAGSDRDPEARRTLKPAKPVR